MTTTDSATVSPPAIVLVGLESVGKSALFRALTGQATGDEVNFRGSTVEVRAAPLAGDTRQVVDTPGLRWADDSATTALALGAVANADTVLLVARGTHARAEVAALLEQLGPVVAGRRAALIFTFADRSHPRLRTALAAYATALEIPVVLVNARKMTRAERLTLLEAVQTATPFVRRPVQDLALPEIPIVRPQPTLFERRRWGVVLSLLSVFALFATPVYLAYLLANNLQPLVEAAVIEPVVAGCAPLATAVPLLHEALVGTYGIVTLGSYSFLWAFPVVLFIGLSVAISEETGLKDRITGSLDPWLRHLGLDGRDLIPVLSGYGCNVVAVFSSRTCSRRTREACTSLIAYGSACSYQIGATLSLFAAAGHPGLFAPYLVLVFLVGAMHTRLWHRPLAPAAGQRFIDRAFVQKPTWRAVHWRVRAVLGQFLGQAMPIFLLMCALGATLAFVGLLDWLAAQLSPLMEVFGLPGAVAPGVVLAVVRKDGMLILNQGQGALLASLTVGQLFVLVYLASTLTACLVTLWTVGKELGARVALKLAARQAATSLASSFLLALMVRD